MQSSAWSSVTVPQIPEFSGAVQALTGFPFGLNL